MKKFILMLIVALSFNTDAMAGEKLENKYQIAMDMSQLNAYLGLSVTQYSKVESVNKFFANQLANLAKSTAANKEESIRVAIMNNCRMMKPLLEEAQYAKYTKMLLMMAKNAGIENIEIQ
jgi:hypothetical protein